MGKEKEATKSQQPTQKSIIEENVTLKTYIGYNDMYTECFDVTYRDVGEAYKNAMRNRNADRVILEIEFITGDNRKCVYTIRGDYSLFVYEEEEAVEDKDEDENSKRVVSFSVVHKNDDIKDIYPSAYTMQETLRLVLGSGIVHCFRLRGMFGMTIRY